MPTPAIRLRPFLREPRHVVACLRLLVFAGLAVLGWSAPPLHSGLFWTVSIVYGLTVLGCLAAGNHEFTVHRARLVLFLFDVAVVAGLLVLRGRDAQALVMAYFMLVLLAALLAGVGNALANGLLVSALFVVVTGWGVPPADLLAFERLGPVIFFFVIAVFMGHVAGESRARARRARAEAASPGLQQSTARLRAARDGARALDRLHTLDLLSAGLAHELRRPLGALRDGCEEGIGLLEDVRARLSAGEDPAEVLAELDGVFEDCRHAAQRLQRVAADLNAVAGSGREVDLVAPGEILAGAERMLRAAAGERVQIEVEAASARCVRADPVRLQQVLLILGDNGIAAMPGGGRLRLRAEDAGEERVAFVVEDTGEGIAPETQERMYDPFFSTREPGCGTGLGLFVLREIVHAQGGRVTCHSKTGVGTAFRVELPAWEASSRAAAGAA